jgi:hypothetical protein
MTTGKKLTGATGGRSIREWVGRTPDTPPPTSVGLRVWNRQKGVCALTGRKIRPGDKKRLDHKVPLADDGENKESNLQWLLDAAHDAKTRQEASDRAKVRKKAKAHAGIRKPPERPLQSRNDLPVSKHAGKRGPRLPPPTTPTGLQRRFQTTDKPTRKP